MDNGCDTGKGKESLRELKQAFDLISNKDGLIGTKEILSLMKSVGQNPTNYELKYIINV